MVVTIPVLPQVRADPDGRCAAMLIYGRKIVILPFRRDTGGSIQAASEGLGAGDGTHASASATGGKVMSTYLLDLQAVVQTNKVDNIIDIQFLHGYR